MDPLTSSAPSQDRLVPIVRRLALGFALTLAAMLPVGYFSLGYSNLTERAEIVAAVKAAAINGLAAATPDMWMYQSHRLEDMLRNTELQTGVRATIRDVTGNSVIVVGAAPPAPTMIRSRAVHDSGRLIGYVDIELSYRDIVIGTLFNTLLGLLLGGTLYGAMLVLPMRTLRRVSAALVNEQNAVRASEERYHHLFNLNPVPLWVFDENTLAFLAVNDATVEKYGWTREELLSMSIVDIRRPEDVPFLMGQIAKGQQDRHSIVSTHRKKDGTLIDVEVRSHHIEYDGRPARIASAYDITERKLAEATLRESEERLRKLLQDVPSIAVQGYAPDGTTQYWNAASEALYGYTAQEAVGRNLLDLIIPTEMRDDVRRAIRQMAATGLPIDASELSLMRKDGSRVAVFSSHVIVQVPGRAPELFCIDVDLTERKSAEAKLRKSKVFLELLLEAIPLPVFYKDAECRYSGCNSAFTKFIGKPRDQVIGRTVFDASPPPFAEIYRNRDLELLNGPADTQVYESQVMHADGTAHDVIFHKARIVDDTGRPTGIIGGIADISDIRRMAAARDHLEAQLRESQKLEALGTLAGGVAHDFNNIIAMIKGNAELACEDLGAAHPALASLDEILKASGRAKNLVQQILAFGRRQALQRKIISLQPAIDESARLLRSTLPAAVSLVVDCAQDAPAVLADAHQIQQLLINLCTNAWQAMRGKGGGVVKIRLRSQVRNGAGDKPATIVRGDPPVGRSACLTVSDDGPGMDEATRARIFEPFFTTKPVGEGTGLGLSVVHGIVQQHDAQIEVQSAPGAGTTFRIYFPAVDGAVVKAEPAPPAEAARCAGGLDTTRVLTGAGKRILYVDDDDAMVLLLTRLLERRGYRVSGYTDAREALAAARAAPDQFDLAVSDYNMPGMSGLHVARELREIRPGLPVAVISGYITDELRENAPAAGVSELIYKPNSVEELCEAIARLAQNRESSLTSN